MIRRRACRLLYYVVTYTRRLLIITITVTLFAAIYAMPLARRRPPLSLYGHAAFRFSLATMPPPRHYAAIRLPILRATPRSCHAYAYY